MSLLLVQVLTIKKRIIKKKNERSFIFNRSLLNIVINYEYQKPNGQVNHSIHQFEMVNSILQIS